MKKIKFIVSSNTLLKALQSIGGVINSKSVLPVLECFLIEINGQTLTATASDLETTISIDVGIDEGADPVSIAMPAKLLLEALKSLPEQPLCFTIDASKHGIEIKSDGGKYRMVGESAEDFPKLPPMENGQSFEINGHALVKGIGSTVFAISNDDLRPALCGVNFDFGDDGMVLAATDAHRLVRYTDKSVKDGGNASFALTKKVLALIEKLAPPVDIVLEHDAKSVAFSFDCYKIMTQLIDGKYPDYNAVIPTSSVGKMEIDRIELIESLKRVAVFSNAETKAIIFNVDGDELRVLAEDVDFEKSAVEVLPVIYTGPPMEIGFTGKFMIDALNSLSSDGILISFEAPNKGILIAPDEEFMHLETLNLVMPQMIAK